MLEMERGRFVVLSVRHAECVQSQLYDGILDSWSLLCEKSPGNLSIQCEMATHIRTRDIGN